MLGFDVMAALNFADCLTDYSWEGNEGSAI
jgi:hypothetical protein